MSGSRYSFCHFVPLLLRFTRVNYSVNVEQMASWMYNTFNPEQSDDGNDETRWHHVECEEPAWVSAVLCGSEGGAGSDVEITELKLTLKLCFIQALLFFLLNYNNYSQGQFTEHSCIRLLQHFTIKTYLVHALL